MTRKVHVLVEGQTEETFVRSILRPHLQSKVVHVNPVVIKTKRVGSDASFKGGIVKYDVFKKQVVNLLGDTTACLVTTMVDLFGLPLDFPGMEAGKKTPDPINKAIHIETALKEKINDVKFVPYIQVHEIESLVLVDPEKLGHRFPDDADREVKARKLSRITRGFESPEHVDGDDPPSRRILREFPTYKKVSHGYVTMKEIGMDRLKAACPHFCSWINRLESV